MANESVQKHQEICKELNRLYERKNHDYGDSFHQTFLEEGYSMSRIRMTDKLSRFKTLTKGVETKVLDESIRDTLLDLANYAIMTAMEFDRARIESMKVVSLDSFTTRYAQSYTDMYPYSDIDGCVDTD